jgi:hypothetical protein
MDGWVAERLKAPVLKTGKRESASWVRIPPHPPFSRIFRIAFPFCGTLMGHLKITVGMNEEGILTFFFPKNERLVFEKICSLSRYCPVEFYHKT